MLRRKFVLPRPSLPHSAYRGPRKSLRTHVVRVEGLYVMDLGSAVMACIQARTMPVQQILPV